MEVVMSFAQSREFIFKTAPLIIVAVIGVQAHGIAAPVEYVKVCSLYGSGFFNIPGTDTCVRLSVGAQVGFGEVNTTFNVNPPFDVRGSGVAYGVNGMALFGVTNTSLSVGPRIGVFGGNMGGSSFYPGSGGTYSVDTRGAFAADLVAQYRPASWGGASFRAFAGIADTRSQTEFNVVRSFVAGSDTSDKAGFTGGVGFNVPIPNFYNGLSVTGEARYINAKPSFYVPGLVGTNRDFGIVTVGFEHSF
jgi:hypothetical protein